MPSKQDYRKKADHIFEKWRADLAHRDRSKDHLVENFDDLFYELYRTNVPFEVAHEYLGEAIAAHLPSKQLVKRTFKHVKKQMPDAYDSEQEFFNGWKKLIEDEATTTFYARYPLEDGSENKPTVELPSGMTREEYIKLRKYANSFPTVDLSELPDPGEEQPEDLES